MAIINWDGTLDKKKRLAKELYENNRQADTRAAAEERKQILKELTDSFIAAGLSPLEAVKAVADSSIGKALVSTAEGAKAQNDKLKSEGSRPFSRTTGANEGDAEMQTARTTAIKQRKDEQVQMGRNAEQESDTASQLLQAQMAEYAKRRTTAIATNRIGAETDVQDLMVKRDKNDRLLRQSPLVEQTDNAALSAEYSDHNLRMNKNALTDVVTMTTADKADAERRIALANWTKLHPEFFDRDTPRIDNSPWGMQMEKWRASNAAAAAGAQGNTPGQFVPGQVPLVVPNQGKKPRPTPFGQP